MNLHSHSAEMFDQALNPAVQDKLRNRIAETFGVSSGKYARLIL
jgi:hypothetical protein